MTEPLKVIYLSEPVVLFFPGPNHDRIEYGPAYLTCDTTEALVVDEAGELSVIPRGLVVDAMKGNKMDIPDTIQEVFTEKDFDSLMKWLRGSKQND